MSIFPDDRSICRCWESHEITREKMVFLRKCQYSRQSACSTHPTFPARIHRWPSGAEKLRQELKNNVQTYLNGCEFTDDFTLVVLEVQSTS